MTLVLSRRTASAVHALWRPSATVNAGKKRKRAEEWVCWRCRQNNTRNYSDDVPYRAGTTVGEYLFSPREERKQEQPVFARRKASLEWRGRHADAWGNGQVELGEDDGSRGSNAATAAAAEEKNGVAQLTAREPADTTLWEKFEAADGDSTEHIRTVRFAVPGDADAGDRAPATTVADPKLLDIDYATLFPDALQEANADLTARCLFAAATAKDHGFVGSMSNATFNEVLRLLEPGRHVDKLMTAHTELSEAMLRQLAIPSLQDVAYEYAQLMSDLVLMRRSAGQRLTYADYIVLLRSARDLGNPRLARSLWRQMALEEIQPDREAWNLYIATVIATRAHVAAGRHKHRITPYHRLARSAPRRGQAFAGYSVGPDGLKTRVMSHFREMLDQGVAADEETFRLVMTAAAREGDIDTVKSILKRVWDINVEALVAGEPESSILPKQIPPDSSLKPTSKLLFTIASAVRSSNSTNPPGTSYRTLLGASFSHLPKTPGTTLIVSCTVSILLGDLVEASNSRTQRLHQKVSRLRCKSASSHSERRRCNLARTAEPGGAVAACTSLTAAVRAIQACLASRSPRERSFSPSVIFSIMARCMSRWKRFLMRWLYIPIVG